MERDPGGRENSSSEVEESPWVHGSTEVGMARGVWASGSVGAPADDVAGTIIVTKWIFQLQGGSRTFSQVLLRLYPSIFTSITSIATRKQLCFVAT